MSYHATARWVKSSHSGDEGGHCVEVAWVKSSYSGAEGGHCVEVAWTKSTPSGDDGGHCVEVAPHAPAMLVRDSKRPAAPHITFGASAWGNFLGHASR